MDIFDLLEVALLVHTMKENSEAWNKAGPDERRTLEGANQEMGETLRNVYGLPVVFNPAEGVWYMGPAGHGLKLYDLY